MKKYILVVLPLVAAFSLAMVSCGHDEIVEEPPVYFNSNGIPVITIKTENAAGVPADKTQSIGCEIKVVDPTGAGDSFAGAMMGVLAEAQDLTPASIKKALLYATVVASLNIEGFSLERFRNVRREEIEERVAKFRESLVY